MRSLLTMMLVLSAVPAWAGEVPALGPKANPTVQRIWQENQSWHGKRRWVECFVQLTGVYHDQMARQLEQAGFHVRSVIPQGDKPATILTGRIRVRNLQHLTALEAVRSIEGAIPVGRKQPMGLK